MHKDSSQILCHFRFPLDFKSRHPLQAMLLIFWSISIIIITLKEFAFNEIYWLVAFWALLYFEIPRLFLIITTYHVRSKTNGVKRMEKSIFGQNECYFDKLIELSERENSLPYFENWMFYRID